MRSRSASVRGYLVWDAPESSCESGAMSECKMPVTGACTEYS